MSERRHRAPVGLASGGVMAAVLGIAVAATGLASGGASTAATTGAARPSPSAAASAAPAAPADAVAADISRQQQQLHAVPRDWQAWASLGFDYVAEAKATVNPAYYPKAAAALRRSLALQPRDNVIAAAGRAALSAARHDFPAALTWARTGLRIDPRSAVLEGALCDALTQLGRYRAAERAARRMELLSPGSGAEARLSYAAELRGDLTSARAFMRAALADSGAAGDAAFARYYLAQLDLSTGHPAAALAVLRTGLEQSPGSALLLEGRARAEAAAGDLVAAARDYRTAVARVPQPSYLLEYGELLQTMGRAAAARRQFAVFRTEERLFRANGVALDTDQALFEADHGSPAAALRVARAALHTRPFLETWDAFAWALHRTGHDRAALRASDRALATGMRNALFHFHRGVLEHALGNVPAARAELATALAPRGALDPLRTAQARRLLATTGVAR